MIKKSTTPTLVDVAREANVSLKTASRVLNGEPGLAPTTAKRVRNVMVKLGYRPNEFARGLKGRKSAVIGMVVPNLADPFCASAAQAVQEVAERRAMSSFSPTLGETRRWRAKCSRHSRAARSMV